MINYVEIVIDINSWDAKKMCAALAFGDTHCSGLANLLIMLLLPYSLVSLECGIITSKSCAAMLVTSGTNLASESKKWKILSYNVWFREDLEMHGRMKALGNLIELHSPDVICFQVFFPCVLI